MNMNIKTGYFAYTKKYEEAGYLPISIALYPPFWYNGIRTFGLAPSKELLYLYKNNCIDFDSFETRYLNELDYSVVDNYIKTWKLLLSNGNYKGIVLLCFESPYEPCHRHTFARYLNVRYNLNVEEFEIV